MQSITPLTSADFKNKSNIVIGKVEIDSDGVGTYIALPDIIDFNINTNIENQVGRLCSYSFSITVLNTDDQFNPYNDISPYYDYLKQGRRIKLYAGIKVSGTEYYYQWLIGRVDDYKLNEQAGQNICTITGRDFMRIITEYRLYSPDTYWGTTELLNTVSGQVRYDLNVNCKGVYIAYLDSTSPYDGSNYEEIYENQDWTYDWHNNQFCFTKQRIPDFAGTNNLKVYCMTTQTVEDAVGHILYLAGIFATNTARDTWIANASYVTPTSKTIDRIWYNTGISALEAIRLLAEVVQYRLYFDYAGNPIFKPKASIGTIVDTLNESDITVENIEENEEETYTHIIIEGEERDRILGDDEMAPAVPSGLELTTGFGESTQAGLAYIKATWDSNTEIDFGHYELRIKKNADTDYTEVSTIATSYMFLGLETGVTYNVQIRACDIYENRSDWSTAENIVTATDSGTPVKIAGETATAILAGIKVEWTEGIEYNISYYKVERQESPDNVDWTGGWVEKAQIDGNMWLDLLLSYSVYYRYRITAYTVAGVVGVTSDFTTAVQPNKAGTNDIVANAITADLIASNQILANHILAGEILTSHLKAGDISLATIASDFDWGTLGDDGNKPDDNADVTGENTALDIINLPATPTGSGLFANGTYLGYYDNGTWKAFIRNNGYFKFEGDVNNYIQWNGSSLAIKGSITLINTIPNAKVDGLGDLALLSSLAYGDIEGTKPPSNADVTLSAINGSLAITGGGITLSSGGAIKSYGKDSYNDATAGFYLGYASGYKLGIGNSSQYIRWNGSSLSIKGSITLENTIPSTDVSGLGDLATEDDVDYDDLTGTKPPSNADVTLSAVNGLLYVTGGGIRLQGGGKIYSYGKSTYADTTAGFFLGYDSGYKFNIGNGSATAKTGNCLLWDGSGLIVRGSIKVGGGSNEDITFEDSGIRLYDAGSNKLYFTRTSLSSFNIEMLVSNINLQSSSAMKITASSKEFQFITTGTLRLPTFGSTAPSGYNGDFCIETGSGDSANKCHFYDGDSQWNYLQDYDSW